MAVADNTYPHGIHRCSILDFDLKFCENSQWSRISADKRFSKCLLAALLALDRGFYAVCATKLVIISESARKYGKLFVKKVFDGLRDAVGPTHGRRDSPGI